MYTVTTLSALLAVCLLAGNGVKGQAGLHKCVERFYAVAQSGMEDGCESLSVFLACILRETGQTDLSDDVVRQIKVQARGVYQSQTTCQQDFDELIDETVENLRRGVTMKPIDPNENPEIYEFGQCMKVYIDDVIRTDDACGTLPSYIRCVMNAFGGDASQISPHEMKQMLKKELGKKELPCDKSVDEIVNEVMRENGDHKGGDRNGAPMSSNPAGVMMLSFLALALTLFGKRLVVNA